MALVEYKCTTYAREHEGTALKLNDFSLWFDEDEDADYSALQDEHIIAGADAASGAGNWDICEWYTGWDIGAVSANEHVLKYCIYADTAFNELLYTGNLRRKALATDNWCCSMFEAELGGLIAVVANEKFGNYWCVATMHCNKWEYGEEKYYRETRCGISAEDMALM